MIRKIHHYLLLPVALITTPLLTGCIVHVGGGDSSARHRSYQQDDDRQISGTAGDISSINDDIRLDDGSTAGQIETVNGDIKMGENVKVRSINTVNGDISGGQKLTVSGPIESVNGEVEIESGSTVTRISSVNGDIELEGVIVQADISSKNGDISLNGDTHILGDVIFEKRNESSIWNWSDDHNRPELEIGPQVSIDGHIILYRDVELKIANQQLEDNIIYRSDKK